METELKLAVAPSDLGRVRQHRMLADLALGAPKEHRLVDTYYDTSSLDLWKHGLTLRVRAEDGAWVQTVKRASSSSAALQQRGEWESALGDEQPQPRLAARQIKDAQLVKLLEADDLAGRLRPVFQNTTHRTTWDIELPDGQQVEFALDSGDVACGENHVAIAELEIELKKGNPAQLFEFALALHEDIPLRISNDSKAARGYAMIQKESNLAVKAKPVRLTRKMTLEDAFQCIGLNCTQQLEANVPGVLKQDVESLHQMRVGLRRLRALFNMFETPVPLPVELQESLDWLAGELGATRDWDVLATSTLDRIADASHEALRKSAASRAASHHKHILGALKDPRFTQLTLGLNSWLYGRHWRLPAGPTVKLARRADVGAMPLLRKAQRRLRNRIAALDECDALARHRTRIAAKKARYAAEFFRDLLPGPVVKRYIGELSKLQDQLGLLNDMAVAGRLLPELENEPAPVAAQALYARGYLDASANACASKLRKPLAAVARLKMTK
ncbi:MAG TPA: CHAD domain-containing protein [Pseudoduganella sp.]